MQRLVDLTIQKTSKHKAGNNKKEEFLKASSNRPKENTREKPES